MQVSFHFRSHDGGGHFVAALLLSILTLFVIFTPASLRCTGTALYPSTIFFNRSKSARRGYEFFIFAHNFAVLCFDTHTVLHCTCTKQFSLLYFTVVGISCFALRTQTQHKHKTCYCCSFDALLSAVGAMHVRVSPSFAFQYRTTMMHFSLHTHT